MKKILKLKDVDPLLFSGSSDKNINYLEDKINAKLVFRGDEIHFEGHKKELKIVESLINDMIYTINLKGYIDIEDIEVLLNSSKEVKSSSKKNGLLDQVILYTHKGAVIAQTAGQKKYYESVDNAKAAKNSAPINDEMKKK